MHSLFSREQREVVCWKQVAIVAKMMANSGTAKQGGGEAERYHMDSNTLDDNVIPKQNRHFLR
jgi:hypothetical protein